MRNTIESLISQYLYEDGGFGGFGGRPVSYATDTGESAYNAPVASNNVANILEQTNISPAQMSAATGIPVGEIVAKIAETVPYGQAKLVGDTWVQPIHQVIGSGEDQQIGPIESVQTYKTSGGINDAVPVGTQVEHYSPSGELTNTTATQPVSNSLAPFLMGAAGLFGGLGGGLDSLFGGASQAAAADAAGGLLPAYGSEAAYTAGLGMTPAAEAALASQASNIPLSSLGAIGAPSAMAGLGGEAALGTGLASSNLGNGTVSSLGALGNEAALASTAAPSVASSVSPTVTGMGLGTGLTAGAAGLGLNAGTAGLGAAGLGAGLTGSLGATNSALGGAALGSTLSSLGTGAGGSLLGSGVGSALGAGAGSALGSGVGSALGNGVTSALGTSLATGLGLNALGNLAGTISNAQAISEARDLINQYGNRASTTLADAYKDAQGLNATNRADLGGNYASLTNNLANNVNAQRNLYGQTNAGLTNTYANTLGNLQNVYNQQVGYQQPYQAVGQAGSQGLLANQPYFTHQFDANDLNTNLAPNYAFQLAQGQMANQRAGNAAGGALGGNALQGLQKYTQDYAGNAYQQAFNNYNAQRNNIYNSLANMAQIGNTSAGQLAGLGNTYSGNLGSLSSNYGGNMLSNAGQLQTGLNQYGSNLTGASNAYGSNLTSAAGQGMNAANVYGLNAANLATGIGSALASNATAGGANTANALSNLGNTALLGSLIKAT